MNNGFTIIELMITITIIAIVVAIGAPNFQATIQNNRLASQTNTLISAINYARSEAVKRGDATITMCGSSDQASCNTADWESGWLIFTDSDGDSEVDTGETILRMDGVLGGENTLRTSGFPSTDNVKFTSSGMVASTGTFTLCDTRGNAEARALVLNLSGQVRTATDEDSTADSIPNDHEGVNVSCP